MLAIYRLPHRIVFGNVFIYKNLHIEPFNYTIKSVCFDFRLTNEGSSVIKTRRSEGSLLPYFYQFRSNYPLITYLSKNYYCTIRYTVNKIWTLLDPRIF